MVTYNPKEWLRPLMQLHKGDTFKKLWVMMAFIAVYTALVCFLETKYFKVDETHLKNVPMMHSLLGFAISMLLVFRTNTAYDRWWEGRKLWGSLVNASRNLAVKLDAILLDSDAENRSYFSSLIGLFPSELRHHLQNEKTRLSLDEKLHPEIPDFDLSRHIPSQIISQMQHRLTRLSKNGTFTEMQILILNTEMIAFLDICGGCERIKNTPIPYTYSSFIKKFIFIYVFTLPLGFVFVLGYLSVPVVVFVFYVLASLEVIAEEIEDPFGTDPNDLPLERLSITISKTVEDILH